jgi:hypothetical protein
MDFDSNGNLKPYTFINSDIATFEEFFVKNFPLSTTRFSINSNFTKFLANFKKEIVSSNFYLWIDGSFVTQKMNPNDLDVVVFLDFETFDKVENQLTIYKSIKYHEEEKLDIYFMKLYPVNHKYNIRTVLDTMEWLDLFSHTRPNKNNKKLPKGFIKISF